VLIILPAVVAGMFALPACYAQPAESPALTRAREANQKILDGRLFSVSLRLDRRFFAPGQEICATVNVANRTRAPRAAVTNSVFRVRRLGDDGRFQPLAQGETGKLDHKFLAAVELPAFAPGQEEQERVCFNSKPKAEGVSNAQKPFGSLSPGRYSLCFSYEQMNCTVLEILAPSH
jgi:hypothetical protein